MTSRQKVEQGKSSENVLISGKYKRLVKNFVYFIRGIATHDSFKFSEFWGFILKKHKFCLVSRHESFSLRNLFTSQFSSATQHSWRPAGKYRDTGYAFKPGVCFFLPGVAAMLS